MRREEEIILLICASLQTITFRSSILHQSWNLVNFKFIWYRRCNCGNYIKFMDARIKKKRQEKVYLTEIHQKHSVVLFDKIIFTLCS